METNYSNSYAVLEMNMKRLSQPCWNLWPPRIMILLLSSKAMKQCAVPMAQEVLEQTTIWPSLAIGSTDKDPQGIPVEGGRVNPTQGGMVLHKLIIKDILVLHKLLNMQ